MNKQESYKTYMILMISSDGNQNNVFFISARYRLPFCQVFGLPLLASLLKNELKYCPVPEGNTCIAEPNLEVLPFRIIQWRASLVFLLKVFKNNLKSDESYKVSLFHYQMTTNSAVNRILACVINNCNNSSY